MTTPPPTMTGRPRRGVVALLDGREEGVEVGMQDRGLAGRRSHTNRCSPTEAVPARPRVQVLDLKSPRGLTVRHARTEPADRHHHREHPRGALGDKVAHWFADEARQRPDLLVDVVDLAEVDIPAVLPMRHTPEVQAYAERIDRADAFVVVTPEYNHSYPASLKQAIDVLNAPWRRKPVAFVSYGGLSGGLRAVEHLRQVFAELHATTIRETVSLHRHPLLFDEAGALVDPPVRPRRPR